MSAVLTGAEIKERNLITGGEDASYRSTSYDVRIGRFIARNEDGLVECSSYYLLKPQGVVEVVSIERLTMPPDVSALAIVKTTLCDKGILALNIGIVDPHWSGPVSTTLVNFSREEYVLNVGDVFLRLMFFNSNTTLQRVANISDDDYLKSKREKALRFSETFLNLEQAIERVTAPVFWKYFGYVGIALGIFVFLLSLLAFLVNLGVAVAGRHYWSTDDVKREVLRDLQADQQRGTDVRIGELNKRIEALRLEIQTLHPVVTSTQPTTPKVNSPSPPTKSKGGVP